MDQHQSSPLRFFGGLFGTAALVAGAAYWYLSMTEHPTNTASTTQAAPMFTAEVATPVAAPALTSERKVFFAYDDSALDRDTRAVLDQWAERLRRDSLLTLQIEGHADERGSVDYNQTLGERRGDAVKAYLVARGINEPRLKVVSFGETNPATLERNETAWSANRRVELRIANVVSQR